MSSPSRSRTDPYRARVLGAGMVVSVLVHGALFAFLSLPVAGPRGEERTALHAAPDAERAAEKRSLQVVDLVVRTVTEPNVAEEPVMASSAARNGQSASRSATLSEDPALPRVQLAMAGAAQADGAPRLNLTERSATARARPAPAAASRTKARSRDDGRRGGGIRISIGAGGGVCSVTGRPLRGRSPIGGFGPRRGRW